jgi:hypothetical protein
MPTPKQMLLELKYDGDLAHDINAWLAGGQSWRQIARTVSERTGLTVTYESLRSWYGTTEHAA